MVTKPLWFFLLLVGATVHAKYSSRVQDTQWKPSLPIRDQGTAESSSAGGYEYSYGVSDPKTGDHKSHSETRNSGTVRGHYSVLESDGTMRTVHYLADPHLGFRAFVSKSGPTQHPTGKSTASQQFFDKPIIVAPLKNDNPAPVTENHIEIPKLSFPLHVFSKNTVYTPNDIYHSDKNIFGENPELFAQELEFPMFKQYPMPPIPYPFLQAPAPDAAFYRFPKKMHHIPAVPEIPEHIILDHPLIFSHAKAPIVRMKYDNTAAPLPVYLGHRYSDNQDMGYGGYKLMYDHKFH